MAENIMFIASLEADGKNVKICPSPNRLDLRERKKIFFG